MNSEKLKVGEKIEMSFIGCLTGSAETRSTVNQDERIKQRLQDYPRHSAFFTGHFS